MIVHYKFQASDKFYTTAFDRHWKQRPTDRYITAFIFFGGGILLLSAGMLAWVDEGLPALVSFCFALVILFCRRFDRLMRLRQIKRSPYWNEYLEASLSESGFHYKGNVASGDVTWLAFTKAVRFPDGVLLYQGPQMFNWLPDLALVEGSTPEQVLEIIQAHTTEVKIIS